MIKIKRIDHIAIAVGDRDDSAKKLAVLFGLCAGATERVGNQGTDVAFLHAPADGNVNGPSDATTADGATALEIIAPAGPSGNASLVRFLARRGPGLHHICFEVEDLPTALAALKAAGVKLIDDVPRPGARGHLVAFLHPESTGGVLFELCATPQGAHA